MKFSDISEASDKKKEIIQVTEDIM